MRHMGVVDRLFSRAWARADDLARGRSTFMMEMVETAAILTQAGAPAASSMLDEIGRGTSPPTTVWPSPGPRPRHLHETNRARTLFATHYHELTALSGRLPRLTNATVRVREWQGDVVFLHEIVAGAADRSYGIQVAKLAGLPPAVIERARAVLAQLEEQDRRAPGEQLIDDLPLFAAAAPRPSAPAAKAAPDPVLEALDAIDPDDLTPRAALEALYKLKQARKKT